MRLIILHLSLAENLIILIYIYWIYLVNVWLVLDVACISCNCGIRCFPSFKCLHCFSFIVNILLVADSTWIIILRFLIFFNIYWSFLIHLIIVILKFNLIQWFVKLRFILNIFYFNWILIALIDVIKIIIKLAIGLLRNWHIDFLKAKISFHHWLLLHLSEIFKKHVLNWFSYALSSLNLSWIVLKDRRIQNGPRIEWIVHWIHAF